MLSVIGFSACTERNGVLAAGPAGFASCGIKTPPATAPARGRSRTTKACQFLARTPQPTREAHRRAPTAAPQGRVRGGSLPRQTKATRPRSRCRGGPGQQARQPPEQQPSVLRPAAMGDGWGYLRGRPQPIPRALRERTAKVTAATAPGATAPLPGGCRRRTPLPRPAAA